MQYIRNDYGALDEILSTKFGSSFILSPSAVHGDRGVLDTYKEKLFSYSG
jgi:hypothetical protein